MQTDAVGLHGNQAAVHCFDLPVPHHLQYLGDGFLVAVHLRIGATAGNQRTVGQIAAVGEYFGNHAQACGFSGFQEQAAGKCHQFQFRVEIRHNSGNGIRQRTVFRRLVVHCAVRFDIGHFQILITAQGLQCAQLVIQTRPQICFGQIHFDTAEVFPIGIAGVCSDAHAVLLGIRQCRPNIGNAAGVLGAGDVGRSNHLQQGFVAAAAFGEIGV